MGYTHSVDVKDVYYDTSGAVKEWRFMRLSITISSLTPYPSNKFANFVISYGAVQLVY